MALLRRFKGYWREESRNFLADAGLQEGSQGLRSRISRQAEENQGGLGDTLCHHMSHGHDSCKGMIQGLHGATTLGRMESWGGGAGTVPAVALPSGFARASYELWDCCRPHFSTALRATPMMPVLSCRHSAHFLSLPNSAGPAQHGSFLARAQGSGTRSCSKDDDAVQSAGSALPGNVCQCFYVVFRCAEKLPQPPRSCKSAFCVPC